MTTDVIADMLSRVKNGYMAHLPKVALPWSRSKESLAHLLAKNGYLTDVTVEGDMPKKTLVLVLKYEEKVPALTDLKRVSKPSLRVYVDKKHLPRVLGGMGMAVISTPQGLKSDKEARKLGFGGEVWCEVW